MNKKYYKYFLILLVPIYLILQVLFSLSKIKNVGEPENYKTISEKYDLNHILSEKSKNSNVFSTYECTLNSEKYSVCLFSMPVENHNIDNIIKIDNCSNLKINSFGFYKGNTSSDIQYQFKDKEIVKSLNICLDKNVDPLIRFKSEKKLILEIPEGEDLKISINKQENSLITTPESSKNYKIRLELLMENSRLYVLIFNKTSSFFLN
jgi:hypothetical protein